MFKRRVPRSLIQSYKEAIWPSMGYARAFKCIKLRLTRLEDSSHKIAFGLAVGAAISFTPIVGTHILQAIAITFILRGNLVAAMTGTLVGNPLTFPFMWGAAIVFGSYLFGLFGVPISTELPAIDSFQSLWGLIKNEPFRIFIPWAMGGYILTLLSLPVFYLIFYNFVKTIKRAHAQARKTVKTRKAHKTAIEITGRKD